MSEQDLVQDLQYFGLDDSEANVYLKLARLGKARAGLLASMLKINRTTTYRILEKLKRLGIVELSLTRPVVFIAVEPSKALQILIERKKEELSAAESKRPHLLDRFSSFVIPEQEFIQSKFSIMQGRDEVYRTIARLAKSAKKEIVMIVSVDDLNKMYYSGTYDLLSEASSKGTRIQILTDVNLQAKDMLDQFSKISAIRHKETPSKIKTAISDTKEIVITVSSGSTNEEVALWTNSESFASAMHGIATNEFSSSIDYSTRMESLKTGKPPEAIKLVRDNREYIDACLRLLGSARREVIIGFSFHPVFTSSPVIDILKALPQSGVKVKVLSGVTPEEMGLIKELHHIIEYRAHGYSTDVQLLIVDEREMLFSSPQKSTNPDGDYQQRINMVTNVSGMVSFMSKVYHDIWSISKESIGVIEAAEWTILAQNCLNLIKAKVEKAGLSVQSNAKFIGKSGQSYTFDLVVISAKWQPIFSVSVLPHGGDFDRVSQLLISSRVRNIDCDSMSHVVAIVPALKEGSITGLAKAMGISLFHSDDPAYLSEEICKKIFERTKN